MEGTTMATYTAQFKLQVAKDNLNAKTYAETSKKYGVPVKSVKEWAAQYSKYGDLAFEEGGPDKFKDMRIRELEKQIADLEEENEILKKATAYFSKKSR